MEEITWYSNDLSMKRIDSHQHFWNYDPTKQVWMNENMGVIKRDFEPHDLEPLLKNCGIDGCVAVQASQSEDENKFLLNLAEKFAFIKGVVGWVDLQSPQLNERLNYYRQFTTIKGFRHVIHDEAAIDFMLRPAFINGVKLLAQYGYTYDLLIFPSHLSNTLEFVKKMPSQSFVIDHIAKPDIANRQWKDWKKKLAKIVPFQHVYYKISGLTTEANWHASTQDDFKIYLDIVVELFGTDRIMFGSDWPVCTLASSYEEVYGIVKNYFAAFTKDEQDKFFGLNAIQFYRL